MQSKQNVQTKSEGLPLAFLRRIEECKAALPRSNCIGTALFIVGETKTDKYVDTAKVNKPFLLELRRIESPIPGALIVWPRSSKKYRVMVAHMGVIVSIEPILVTHRAGRNGLFLENEPLVEAGGCWHQKALDFPGSYSEVYYLPRVLQ